MSHQDDLAEHTMHSPVILDLDPSFHIADGFSDWEYYTDEYYDQDPKKRGRGDSKHNTSSPNRSTGVKRTLDCQGAHGSKRRKRARNTNIPELSLDNPLNDESCPSSPIVIWRTEDAIEKIPLMVDGHGEKVAILKDWRERFKIPLKGVSKSSSRIPRTRQGQGPRAKAVAAEVQTQPAKRDMVMRGAGAMKSRKRLLEPEDDQEANEPIEAKNRNQLLHHTSGISNATEMVAGGKRRVKEVGGINTADKQNLELKEKENPSPNPNEVPGGLRKSKRFKQG